MKILYHIPYPRGIGDDRTIYDGYRYAFEELGHTVHPLTEHDDLERTLSETKPDLFITALAVINPLRNTHILKNYRLAGGGVLMRGGGEESDKELIRRIREDNLGDIYAVEREYPKFFELTGKQLKLLPLAASRQYHFPVPPVKKYECDIVYVGANLPRKKILFQKRLFPLFKKYRVRVFGADWDAVDKYFLHPLAKLERMTFHTQFITNLRINRQVPYSEENQAYASARIALNFHEQLPGGVFLLNGRTFKIPACGGFEICDYVPLARRYFDEDELVMAESDDDFFRKVDYYMSHDEERVTIQKKGTTRALRDHTYHNRAALILGWYKEAINGR